MASNVNNNQNLSLDELWATKCTELREILKQNVSGNKHILVARCYALTPVIDERKKCRFECRHSGRKWCPG
jgi:hypothetical protein